MSRPACLPSWANGLGMVQQRQPTVSAYIVQVLNHQHPLFHLAGLRACGAQLAAVGFHPYLGRTPARSSRLGCCRYDWHRIATIPVHGELVEGSVRPRLSQSEQALFRSQGDPLLSVPFTYFPTSLLSRFDASLFRVLLLRRLCLPTLLPHTSAGVAVSVMSQATPCSLVCSRKRCSPCLPRGRSPCHHKRDGTGPGFVAVAPGGRPLAGGGCGWSATLPWRVALVTTLVSPSRRDWTPHTRCAVEDGVALMQARRRKERTYPELSGAHGRARLVLLACEVGGRWSSETEAFLRQFAKCPRFRTVSVGRTCHSWARWPHADD